MPTHNTVTLRGERHGEAELSQVHSLLFVRRLLASSDTIAQHPRNTSVRWPLLQEKGFLNAAPTHSAEVRAIVFPSGHGDVQQQPVSIMPLHHVNPLTY